MLVHDSLCMQYLMNSLDGEDKKLVKTLGTSSYFYAMASKVKIKDFGNPFVVPHLKFKTQFDQKK